MKTKDKLGRKINLPEEYRGQFKNPEVQAKAAATREKNRLEKIARKEAASTGFSKSVASDPDAQAALINSLWQLTLDPSDKEMFKFAIKTLNDMGVIKQPTEKPTEEQKEAKIDIQPEDAINILKAASKKNLEDFEEEKSND